MTQEEILREVSKIPNVVHVAHAGSVEHLSIVVLDPAPFAEITAATEGVQTVDVRVATRVSDAEASRFREDRSLAPMFTRSGRPAGLSQGDATAFAANLGITIAPVFGAMLGDRLGVLFASVDDAEAYDCA